jgi:hypothetical protein
MDYRPLARLLTLLTIRDSSNEDHSSRHVVKEAITALLPISKADKGQSSDAHSGAYGEEEIGSMCRKCYVGSFPINSVAWRR